MPTLVKSDNTVMTGKMAFRAALKIFEIKKRDEKWMDFLCTYLNDNCKIEYHRLTRLNMVLIAINSEFKVADDSEIAQHLKHLFLGEIMAARERVSLADQAISGPRRPKQLWHQ